MIKILSEVFRAEHCPDQIDEHESGHRAAQDKIEHFYTFPQAGT
jgi:hypothetical protein